MATELLKNKTNPLTTGVNTFASILPMFSTPGNTSSTTTQTANTAGTLSPEILAALGSNITGGAYSKNAAIGDSSAVINRLMQSIMEAYTPKIASAQRGSGAYNDSTTKLLMNDLQARAAGEGAKVQMDTIKNYADIVTNSAKITSEAAPKTTTQTNSQQTQASAPKNDWLSAALVAGGSAILPSVLGGLAGMIFNSGDSGASDAPPGIGKKGKNLEDIFSSNNLSAMADFISPQMSSVSDSGLSSLTNLTSPILDFLSSPSSSGSISSGAASTAYSSPDIFSSVLDSIGGSFLGDAGSAIGEGLSNLNVGGFFSDLFGGWFK